MGNCKWDMTWQGPDPCVCFRNQPGKKKSTESQVVTFHRLRCRYLRRAFFTAKQTQTQIRNRSGTRSCLLWNRCNFCFSLRDHRFFSCHCILLTSSLMYDRLLRRVSLQFARNSLQGADRALPKCFLCVAESTWTSNCCSVLELLFCLL